MTPESEPTNTEPVLFWHVYGSTVGADLTTPDPDGEVFMMLTAGPTNLGPDDINPAKGVAMRDALELPHLGCFDHEPSDFERDQLQPETHQDFYPDGTDRPQE